MYTAYGPKGVDFCTHFARFREASEPCLSTRRGSPSSSSDKAAPIKARQAAPGSVVPLRMTKQTAEGSAEEKCELLEDAHLQDYVNPTTLRQHMDRSNSGMCKAALAMVWGHAACLNNSVDVQSCAEHVPPMPAIARPGKACGLWLGLTRDDASC